MSPSIRQRRVTRSAWSRTTPSTQPHNRMTRSTCGRASRSFLKRTLRTKRSRSRTTRSPFTRTTGTTLRQATGSTRSQTSLSTCRSTTRSPSPVERSKTLLPRARGPAFLPRTTWSFLKAERFKIFMSSYFFLIRKIF